MLLLLLPVSLMNMTLTVTLNAKVLYNGRYQKPMDGTSDGSGSKWRCDGWYKSEQVNERWMVQATDGVSSDPHWYCYRCHELFHRRYDDVIPVDMS